MKLLHAAVFAVVLTVAGSPVLRAQQPDEEREKPKQQEEDKKKQPPPPREKPQPKPDERVKTEPDKDKTKPDADRKNQPQKEKEKEKAERREQERPRPEAGRAENGRNGQRTNVRRIPEETYRRSFGREHHFHVARREQGRFLYSGYVFEFVDVWPADWSDDDDCYLEEDGDDYYLVDLRHPGVRILVVIVG